MAQGIFAGVTSYKEQSLEDIRLDIEKWIEMSTEVKSIIESKIAVVQKSGFWKEVDYDFVAIVYRTLKFIDTIIFDLRIVNEAIYQDKISEREVNILDKLGNNLENLEFDFRKSYKSNSDWKDYDNKDFREVEEIYMEGDGYIYTLLDICNVVDRIKCYMKKEQSTNNNINISGIVSGVQIQQDTSNSSQVLEKDNNFDYEVVKEILETIKKSTNTELFENDFSDKSEEVIKLVNETIELTDKKENPNKIKSNLNSLKELVINISGSVIASGIYDILKNILIV